MCQTFSKDDVESLLTVIKGKLDPLFGEEATDPISCIPNFLYARTRSIK